MEHIYVIGIDYGTDSVRALLADARTGEEVAVAVCNYARWSKGLFCDSARSQFRQHPLDYLEGLEQVLREVISRCPAPEAIRAIAVDTTASTPCLVNRACTPLSLTAGYESDPDAMFVLWKDHTAQRESEQITALCARGDVNYASRSGNHYSSECFWSKVLHLLRGSEQLRRDAWAVVELCDWIPAVLTGCRDVKELRISHCAAGSKVMWAEEWGGYPPEEFFAQLDPVLVPILKNLPQRTYGCNTPAGKLNSEWAAKLGLSTDVVIGVGNVDAHSGAVGAGVSHKTVVLNVGTSACYMAVMPAEEMGGRLIEGIFGQVDGSILPAMVGFEAGLSAFGDVYAWFKRLLCWPMREILLAGESENEQLRRAVEQAEDQLLVRLADAAARLPLRADAPLATDYLNGRRSPYPCNSLTGSVAGLNLSTTAPELYYAFAEATVFATKAVLDHFSANGVDIERLVAIGGISQKSPLVMQLLADVMGMKIEVSSGSHACALGAVVHAATVAGLYPSVGAAQQALCPPVARTYHPDAAKASVLKHRYERYRALGAFTETLF
ncbi:ribulokinase [uncultured Alistipes sp.]|uniref:ribulokinase n=1 Tax=uncultured Alistipes sp. TaxID=538949 RepID=UPI0025FF43E1|nr:ribulokinase [uncultured Alistipes sp.]